MLDELRFQNNLHARTVIEIWRREYNEERPKNALGGLTPATYAKRMAEIDNADQGLYMAPLLKAGARRLFLPSTVRNALGALYSFDGRNLPILE